MDEPQNNMMTRPVFDLFGARVFRGGKPVELVSLQDGAGRSPIGSLGVLPARHGGLAP